MGGRDFYRRALAHLKKPMKREKGDLARKIIEQTEIKFEFLIPAFEVDDNLHMLSI